VSSTTAVSSRQKQPNAKNWSNAMRGFLVAILMIAASSAGAEYVFDEKFRLSETENIAVALMDKATGACWTNLREVREYAEEKLKIKGAKIDNDIVATGKATYTFNILVSAKRVYANGTGPCAGVISVDLHSWDFGNGILHRSAVGVAMNQSISTNNLNRSVIETVGQLINNFKK